MRTTILTAALVGFIGFALSGCDEPAYEGGVDRPTYTTEQETRPTSAPRPGGGGSALGGARKAADRTVDRAAQHQERIRRNIEDD